MSTLKIKEKSGISKHWSLMLFVLPAALIAFVFCYVPMFGLIMAFKDNIDITAYDSTIISIIMSPWGGLVQFKNLFFSANSEFLGALRNTLIISVLKIVIVFPIPIFLAIIITEEKNKTINKTVQSAMYLPHFLSWSIVTSIFISFLHVNTGSFSIVLKAMGLNPIDISNANHFRGVVVFTTGWKDVGWSAVAYIAAIMGIDQEQYEAAKIDGASKVRQVFSITLPNISSIIAVLLIMRIGYLMDAGFEQVYALLTPTAESKGEIIGTYIYKKAIKEGGSYALTTAAGLFNSVISLGLILGGNWLCKRTFDRGIF